MMGGLAVANYASLLQRARIDSWRLNNNDDKQQIIRLKVSCTGGVRGIGFMPICQRFARPLVFKSLPLISTREVTLMWVKFLVKKCILLAPRPDLNYFPS